MAFFFHYFHILAGDMSQEWTLMDWGVILVIFHLVQKLSFFRKKKITLHPSVWNSFIPFTYSVKLHHILHILCKSKNCPLYSIWTLFIYLLTSVFELYLKALSNRYYIWTYISWRNLHKIHDLIIFQVIGDVVSALFFL